MMDEREFYCPQCGEDGLMCSCDDSLDINNRQHHSAIGLAMASMKTKIKPYVLGFDLSKGDDYTVEIKGYMEDGKMNITEIRKIAPKPELGNQNID